MMKSTIRWAFLTILVTGVAVAAPRLAQAQVVGDPGTAAMSVDCEPGKVHEVKVGITKSEVIFFIDGCACAESAEELISTLTKLDDAMAEDLWLKLTERTAPPSEYVLEVTPGRTTEEVIYCYDYATVEVLLKPIDYVENGKPQTEE